MSRSRLALGLLACSLLAACGSTVQARSTGSDAVGSGLSVGAQDPLSGGGQQVPGAPSPGSQSAASSGSTGGVPSVNGGASSVGAGTSTGAGNPAGSSGNASTSVGGRGPVAPAEVGIAYFSDAATFGKALGANYDTGDQKRQADDMVAYVNSHGGLGGRRITPVYFALKLTSSTPYSESLSAACSAFTQDHHVVAAMFVTANAPNDLAKCLAAKGIPYLAGGFYLHDTRTLQEIPTLIAPYEGASDRSAAALVRELIASGALTSKSRVGVMSYEYPGAQRAYSEGIAPVLKAKGISSTLYTVNYPASTPDIANSASAIQGIVLHMRSDGVDTVLFLAPGGESIFMTQAENQGYRPHYGLSSIDTPVNLTQGGGTPAAQLKGATGIGWEPTGDVGTYGKPHPAGDNPTRQLCRNLMSKNGDITGNFAEFSSQQFCDAFLVLQQAAQTTSGNVTSVTLARAVASLGTRHESSVTFSTLLTPHRRAGVAQYRALAYNDGCSCFQYSGPLKDLN